MMPLPLVQLISVIGIVFVPLVSGVEELASSSTVVGPPLPALRRAATSMSTAWLPAMDVPVPTKLAGTVNVTVSTVAPRAPTAK